MFTGLEDPALWVAVAFFGLVAIILYYGIPGKIAGALDSRANEIRAELDEAKRLREEAQAVLAEYQRKQRSAEQEAEEIVTQAKREAEILAAETEQKLTEQLERRTVQAEDKIARAEAQAMDEVRSAAAELSVQAARNIIAQRAQAGAGDKLIDEAIASISTSFAPH